MDKYVVLMDAEITEYLDFYGTTNSVLSLSIITVGIVVYFCLVHSCLRYFWSILGK